MREENLGQHPVILFDGVCNLCNNAIQFVIKRDKKNVFKFASLQSSFGQQLLKKHGIHSSALNSLILVKNTRIYSKSTAALKVVRKLKGPWRNLYIFTIIPAFIRDFVYDFVALNRYKWFGKQEACWMPTAELINKFLD